MRIKFLNQEALDYQSTVEQPTFWAAFKATVGFTCLMEAEALMVLIVLLPCPHGYAVGRIAWLIGVYGLWTLMAFSFRDQYPGALRFPPESVPSKNLTQIIILLLLATFLFNYAVYFWELHHTLLHLIAISKTHQQRVILQKTIIATNNTLWRPEHWGTDILGVVLGSVSVLLAPFFEELFFRGYMLNSLCQRYHPFTAICVSAFLFALCHIFSKPLQAIPFIFLLGFCCGIIRLRTGRWQDAWRLHFWYNFLFIVPKIAFAGFRFLILP